MENIDNKIKEIEGKLDNLANKENKEMDSFTAINAGILLLPFVMVFLFALLGLLLDFLNWLGV